MPPRIPSLTIQSSISSTLSCPKCYAQSRQTSRFFSTAPAKANRQRIKMWEWINGPGAALKHPLPGSTNYLGAYDSRGQLIRGGDSEDGRLPPESGDDLRPFTMNKNFRSQHVLSEDFREAIWDKVMNQKMSVAQVSRDLGVEMNRVGAVVRLKEIEKQWTKEGKRLARPYAKAVMSMVPQTHYQSNSDRPSQHESINDLPVHQATGRQIFYPTSESREFTRADAAKVFDPRLLPADMRIPHPEMIKIKKDEIDGLELDERIARIKEMEKQDQEMRAKRKEIKKQRQEATTTRVTGQRWEFRFKEVSVDEIGSDGRGAKATGFRYGAPSMDRKRAAVKIPTKVIS